MSTQHPTQYPAALYGLGSSWNVRDPLTPLKDANTQPTGISLLSHSAAFKNVHVTDHESLLYANGTLPRPIAFSFSKEMIRIDWRALAGVDIDRLV